VIELVGDKKFRAFEVPGADSDVVIFVRKIELSESPIDDSQLFYITFTFFF